MNYKKFAIILMIIYVVVSPVLIINSEIQGYNWGFLKGYNMASVSHTPLHNYKIHDVVKSTDEYSRYFNVSFVGEISGFTPNGVLTIRLVTSNTTSSGGILPMGTINKYSKGIDTYFIINEYWTTEGD